MRSSLEEVYAAVHASWMKEQAEKGRLQVKVDKMEQQLQQEREARRLAEQQYAQAASQGFWQEDHNPTSMWAPAAAAAGAAPMSLQQQPPALVGYGTGPVASHYAVLGSGYLEGSHPELPAEGPNMLNMMAFSNGPHASSQACAAAAAGTASHDADGDFGLLLEPAQLGMVAAVHGMHTGPNEPGQQQPAQTLPGFPSLPQASSDRQTCPHPGFYSAAAGEDAFSQQQAELQGQQEEGVGHGSAAAAQPGAEALSETCQHPAGQQPAQPVASADFGAAAYAGQIPAAAQPLAPPAEPLDGLHGLDEELNGAAGPDLAGFDPDGFLAEPMSPPISGEFSGDMP